ncbi:MAG: carboxypeptidase-like regulatory domain-containing protein [Phaeodactylibacter sp.]|nr:carboxypeptidase-like regulatory domain-containing protein [Phaeodactylibacter sp.]
MKTTALLLSFILAFIFISAHAQEYAQGRVADADTGEPVPFVNIGIPELNVGTVSDERGKYGLRVNSPEDVVVFSSIGYHTENIEAGRLLSGGDVTLRQRPYDIPAVEVSAGWATDVIIGAKLEERGHSIGFGSSELGTEIGAHIEIGGKATFIKSAHFTVNHAAGDSLLFRVNLYEFVDGEVRKNLLPQNVIISAVQTRGAIDIDLSKFNLVTSRDVLLSLEWIKDDEGSGNVGITFRSEKSRRGNNVYTKHTSQAPFRRLSDLAPRAPKLLLGFYLVGRQDN